MADATDQSTTTTAAPATPSPATAAAAAAAQAVAALKAANYAPLRPLVGVIGGDAWNSVITALTTNGVVQTDTALKTHIAGLLLCAANAQTRLNQLVTANAPAAGS